MSWAPAAIKRGHNQMFVASMQEAVGVQMRSWGQAAGSASTAWPLANLAIYIPVSIIEPITISAVMIETGITAGGNYDIGLYDSAGNKLFSTGTLARTASALTTTNITDFTVTAPGLYYMAMSADSTANYFGHSPAAGLCEAAGICEQQTAFTLPATATMVRTTRAFIPQFHLLTRATAL